MKSIEKREYLHLHNLYISRAEKAEQRKQVQETGKNSSTMISNVCGAKVYFLRIIFYITNSRETFFRETLNQFRMLKVEGEVTLLKVKVALLKVKVAPVEGESCPC